MMRIFVSGASGLVGRYVVNGLQQAGHTVIAGTRNDPPPGWFTRPAQFRRLILEPNMDQATAFQDVDAFVHAAFDHVAGRYRGGEGNDPDGFWHRNLAGSVRLFENAKSAGVGHVVFLSSRAVYDDLPLKTVPFEDTALRPTSLYGKLKLATEEALAGLASPVFRTTSFRLTGVYGNLRPNKWDKLVRAYLDGEAVPVRAGSEVHGQDVARAILLLLEKSPPQGVPQTFNISDILTDTATILTTIKRTTGCPHPLPADAGKTSVTIMPTDRIRRLGWRPGGLPLLLKTVEELAGSLSR